MDSLYLQKSQDYMLSTSEKTSTETHRKSDFYKLKNKL